MCVPALEARKHLLSRTRQCIISRHTSVPATIRPRREVAFSGHGHTPAHSHTPDAPAPACRDNQGYRRLQLVAASGLRAGCCLFERAFERWHACGKLLLVSCWVWSVPRTADPARPPTLQRGPGSRVYRSRPCVPSSWLQCSVVINGAREATFVHQWPAHLRRRRSRHCTTSKAPADSRRTMQMLARPKLP